MPDGPIELTREQLYDLIWSEPMTALASRFGISDRGLGKICERYEIPKPGRGYWGRNLKKRQARRPPLRPMMSDGRRPEIIMLPGPGTSRQEARGALEYAREHNRGIGEVPALPSPSDPSEPISRHLARDLWRRGQKRAGLAPRAGRGWHSLRRKFASDLMHKPLKVLSQLEGWKNAQTILICYQHPDQEQLREALADRRGRRRQA